MDAAREGLLSPGKAAGFLELLDWESGEVVDFLPVRSEVEGETGILRLFGPTDQAVRLVSRPVAIRPKRHWLFACDCGRLVRRLYRPGPDADLERSLFSLWMCRHCTGIVFPRGRARRSTLGTLSRIDQQIAELLRLRSLVEQGHKPQGREVQR